MNAPFPNRFCGRARPPGLRRAEACPVKRGEATSTQAGAPLFSRVCNGIGRARRSRPTNDRATAAFSLVEVALAVAVIAIGLLAVIGLFPQGLQSARDAADNTLSATIVQDVFSYIRTQPFNNVNITVTPRDLNTYTSPIGFPDILNFDQSGTQTVAAAYYRVEILYQSQSPLPLSMIRATVVWPASSLTPLNTNIFVTEVAWYDNP